VRYVVIGAQAAVIHGVPLLTEDLDITPARDPENLERLAAALRELEALLRSPTDPEGVAFPIDARMLSTAETWTLVTRVGDRIVRGWEDLVLAIRQLEAGSTAEVRVLRGGAEQTLRVTVGSRPVDSP